MKKKCKKKKMKKQTTNVSTYGASPCKALAGLAVNGVGKRANAFAV